MTARSVVVLGLEAKGITGQVLADLEAQIHRTAREMAADVDDATAGGSDFELRDEPT